MNQEVKDQISHQFPNLIWVDKTDMACLSVSPNDLVSVCSYLKSEPTLYFDMLSHITAIDLSPSSSNFQVVYGLDSITKGLRMLIQVEIERENAAVSSISTVWKAADWHEREIFDLFGISFEGHPDMRRILMPSDWVGHPLRKDYKEQLTYHGIQVASK